MTILYEVAVLGSPSDAVIGELKHHVAEAIVPFGLRLGEEVAWHVRPSVFEPEQRKSAAAVFFGATDAPLANVESLLRRGV